MTTEPSGIKQNPWNHCLATLLYVVQFDTDPTNAIDRLLTLIVLEKAVDDPAAEYLTQIRAALASDAKLATLLPQPHPEPVIRDFLWKFEQRLATELARSSFEREEGI